MKFETGLFPSGDELGHICVVVLEQKYHDESGDQTFVYTVPEKPASFDLNLTGSAGDILHKWIGDTSLFLMEKK